MKIGPEKRKELYKLIHQWTRAEIMARMASIDFPAFADYALAERELRDKIREHMYGDKDLVVLGYRWGLLKEQERAKTRGTRRTQHEKETKTSRGRKRASKEKLQLQRQTSRHNNKHRKRSRNGRIRKQHPE